MVRAVGAAAVLLLTFALSGWAPGFGGTGPRPQSSGAIVADDGSDLGNGRPAVTYDGLMVRRRVVIAVHPPSDADIALLRNDLDLAATRRHTTLSTISASVLDPAVLASLTPELVVALPAGTTRADAARLIDAAAAEGRPSTDEDKEYDVLPVLVHDLRFTVSTPDPAALSRAITREGILSDALGNYTTTLGSHRLDIAYTGPLLSDHLVESVRSGIARPGHLAPGAVAVAPRSTAGVGVDMAREPAPTPEVITSAPDQQESTGGGHGTAHDPAAAAPVTTASSGSSLWADVLAAAVVLLIFLAMVRLFAMKPSASSSDR
jgi:hypothetical protein